ncbi:unnamed protein product [Rotaria sp. Silwood2]|nr:unnamed protein product [Rotaria sp. Silwood2]
MNLIQGRQVRLNVFATSEYPSHIVELFDLYRPENATFDRNTGIFRWTAISGEYYLSIGARDTTYNLISKHDITFYVQANAPSTVTPNSGRNTTVTTTSGSNNLVKEANFIITILGLTVLFG